MMISLIPSMIQIYLKQLPVPETATSTSQPSLACDISPVTPVSVAPGPSSDTTSAMPAQGGYIYELF